MPEAPDLEIIKDYLNEAVAGRKVVSARVLKPTVVRSLRGDFVEDVQGGRLENVERRGKFLLLAFSGGASLVVNPMLTGAFQHCPSSDKLFKRVCFLMSLSGGWDLRYLDQRQMGRVYYVDEQSMSQIPNLYEQGPDVLDGVAFEEFEERLRPFYGEIKGILTRGRVLSGIGNAYSDEILFEAGIYPFRKKRDLSEDERRRLLEAAPAVVRWAMEELRPRVGSNIHRKIRDFLKVHNKGGEPCPRCGSAITQIGSNQRITSYCRRCQPGLLLRN